MSSLNSFPIPPGTPLASLTVEQLDALPVGSRFENVQTHDLDIRADWAFAKQDDGCWHAPEATTRGSRGLLETWGDVGSWDYQLVSPTTDDLTTLRTRVADLEAALGGLVQCVERDHNEKVSEYAGLLGVNGANHMPYIALDSAIAALPADVVERYGLGSVLPIEGAK